MRSIVPSVRVDDDKGTTMGRFPRAAVALIASTALLAACSGSDDKTADKDGKVTITWWHNGNNDPLKAFWQSVADEFTKTHPNVKVEISALQNEDLRTRLTTALQSNNPPDLYQQWGGGELSTQVEAGRVMDITDKVSEEAKSMGGAVNGWQVDGKTYGLPFSLGVVGFWYNKDFFAKAGITTPPATLDEWIADIAKLKAAGIQPVSVGAADKWPAAHYWYYTATRECTKETLAKAQSTFDFSDACWLRAGQALQKIIAVDPFNKGYLATAAQQGAGSSAGLLANGKVAMELMGHWNPSVMNGLTPDQKGLGDKLGWFPFPSLPDGQGDPAAAMGGGDGFSCSRNAPAECVDLLKYIASKDVQTRFGATGVGLPTVVGAETGVKDVNMKTLIDFRNKAPYVQLYLDTAYGPNVGGALNDAVALLFAKKGSPEDVVKAVQAAGQQK